MQTEIRSRGRHVEEGQGEGEVVGGIERGEKDEREEGRGRGKEGRRGGHGREEDSRGRAWERGGGRREERERGIEDNCLAKGKAKCNKLILIAVSSESNDSLSLRLLSKL